MKKVTFVMLQLVLSVLLIVFGILIEINGKNSADGVSVLLFTVPGLTIFLACILDGFKFKKPWLFPVLVLVISILADGAVILIYKVSLSKILYFGLFIIVDIIASAISELFHLVVIHNNK